MKTSKELIEEITKLDKMRTISLKDAEALIDKYINEYKGELTELEEGCLGLGKLILHNAEGKKTIIIQEFYINSQSSGHKIRKYNKMPKKYSKQV